MYSLWFIICLLTLTVLSVDCIKNIDAERKHGDNLESQDSTNFEASARALVKFEDSSVDDYDSNYVQNNVKRKLKRYPGQAVTFNDVSNPQYDDISQYDSYPQNGGQYIQNAGQYVQNSGQNGAQYAQNGGLYPQNGGQYDSPYPYDDGSNLNTGEYQNTNQISQPNRPKRRKRPYRTQRYPQYAPNYPDQNYPGQNYPNYQRPGFKDGAYEDYYQQQNIGPNYPQQGYQYGQYGNQRPYPGQIGSYPGQFGPYPGQFGPYPPQESSITSFGRRILDWILGADAGYLNANVPRPGLSNNPLSLPPLGQALDSLARHDDLQCVPKLLCDVVGEMAPKLVDPQKILPSFVNLESVLNIASVIPSQNPVLSFGRAVLQGVSNPFSCTRTYPNCPREPEKLVYYLNNHRGGFFRFFNGGSQFSSAVQGQQDTGSGSLGTAASGGSLGNLGGLTLANLGSLLGGNLLGGNFGQYSHNNYNRRLSSTENLKTLPQDSNIDQQYYKTVEKYGFKRVKREILPTNETEERILNSKNIKAEDDGPYKITLSYYDTKNREPQNTYTQQNLNKFKFPSEEDYTKYQNPNSDYLDKYNQINTYDQNNLKIYENIDNSKDEYEYRDGKFIKLPKNFRGFQDYPGEQSSTFKTNTNKIIFENQGYRSERKLKTNFFPDDTKNLQEEPQDIPKPLSYYDRTKEIFPIRTGTGNLRFDNDNLRSGLRSQRDYYGLDQLRPQSSEIVQSFYAGKRGKSLKNDDAREFEKDFKFPSNYQGVVYNTRREDDAEKIEIKKLK